MPLPNIIELKDKLKWAYIAGIIDGEGTFKISKDARYGREIYYALSLTISNTNDALMEWLSSHLGGSVYTKARKNLSHKPHKEWYAPKGSIETIIRGVYSFLVIKKKHAQVAMTYLSCKDTMGGETFYLQMRELNKKGTNYDSEGSG